ncbi:sensory rhodopsin transducer [Modicisalibacter luteus]|uniref:sensory rhodopsin transducer n=1 Tax=Modicisalibacter luteus TaxID=453962 RepID=UPI003628EB6A
MAEDPFPLCASVFESSVPIVVQHSRLDSRQCELALLSTVAFPASRGVTLFGSKGALPRMVDRELAVMIVECLKLHEACKQGIGERTPE